jgi:hypothetical protein
MNPNKSLTERRGLIAGIILLGMAAVWASPQSAAPQAVGQSTAGQQKQLDRLNQLEERLQSDRDALQQAVNQHGWDSDEADQAQEALASDRTEYRKFRRSMRAAGMDLPSNSEFRGNETPGGGPGSPRAHHHGCCWQEQDEYCCHQYDDAYCCRGRGR